MHSDHHHTSDDLTLAEKLNKILSHWKTHNADHAQTYHMWAERADADGLADAAVLLKKAAEMTLRVNETFDKAIKSIPEIKKE